MYVVQLYLEPDTRYEYQRLFALSFPCQASCSVLFNSLFLVVATCVMSSSISSRSSSLLVSPDSKKVCEMYFGKKPVVGSESKLKCTCGTVRSQNVKLGYSNLMSHIKLKHANYLDMFVLTEQANEDRREAAGHDRIAELSRSTGVTTAGSSGMSSVSGSTLQTTLNFMMDTRSNNIFKWLEWIVMDEHELIFCEKPLTRCNAKLEPISVKTLKKYLFKVVEAVEKKITVRASVAVSYALVFDGWSEASRHFIGLFIVYPGKQDRHQAAAEPDMHLLAFAPLVDETNFTADNHMKFITSTLEWYSIPLDRLFCLIGDNCSTNKATANRLGVPLLGCRSHRFNLSVEQYLRKFLATESELVGKLMSKLSTLKQSGRLRLITPLRPVKRNETRWTGVPNMFQRFERLLPNLNSANQDDEVLDLIPNADQKRNIRERKQALADFKSVTIALQRMDMSMKESDVLFRSIVDAYPEFGFEAYLGTDADIIHNKALEIAVIKIQSNKENTLTDREKESVEPLLLLPQERLQGVEAACEGGDDEQLSFAERALKRQRLQESIECSKYINTSFLLPTSCVVERLFSQAKRVFSPHRRSLHTKTLEALLFLKENRELWNVAMVAVIVNERDEELAADNNEAEDDEDGVEDDEWE
jgi:hAT family C-terminal dimerisation region